MAGSEDLADEAAEARDDEMPGTRSPANEPIGANGAGSVLSRPSARGD